MEKRLCSVLLAAALLLSPALAENQPSVENVFPATRTYIPFSDVGTDAWYAPYVQLCYEVGLLEGAGGGLFNPDGLVSGGEVMVLAARLHYRLAGNTGAFPKGLSAEEALATLWPTDADDPEVRAIVQSWASAWFWDGACYLMRQEGADELTMDHLPTEAVSRLEVAEFFSFGTDDLDLGEKNQIAAIPDDHSPAVLRLYRAGVLTGTDESGSFRGIQFITRAEVAAILARIIRPDLRQTVSVDALEDNYTLTPVPLEGRTWLPLEDRMPFYDKSRMPTATSLQYVIFRTGELGDDPWNPAYTYGLMEPNGTDILPAVYNYVGEPWESGIVPVSQGDKWGYVNLSGQTLIPPGYDRVSTCPGNILLTWNEDKEYLPTHYYLFDLTGAPLGDFPAEGRIIAPHTNFQEGVIPFSLLSYRTETEGYIEPVQRAVHTYGYLNQAGETVIPAQFNAAHPFSEGHAVVLRYSDAADIPRDLRYKLHWQVGVINHTGTMTMPFGQDYLPDFFNPNQFEEGSFTTARLCEDGVMRHGAIATDGTVVVPHTYHSLGGFENGMAFFRSLGQTGLLRHDGSRLMLSFDRMNDFELGFSGGYLSVSTSHSGGLYGYCDETGKLVVPLRFTTGTPIHNGRSLVENSDGLFLLTLTIP